MDTELFTWHTQSDTLNDFKVGLTLAQNSGAKSLLVLTCNQNNYPEKELSSLLSDCPLKLFGGIYPMLTLQDSLLKQGALIIGFKDNFDVTLFSQLNHVNNEDCLEKLITSTLEQKYNFSGHDNFLIFYDALIGNMEGFVDCLFECLDHGINIAGGGAGSLDFIQRPCIFTNQGIHSNAVLLVTLPRKLNTSVAHGWSTFQGPFLVTETQGQTVKSLDYRPAYEVYCQTIESTSEHKFNNAEFSDIAKYFPLGIEDINNNLIVRDPILAHDNNLQCVGNIPINSMVYLLEGNTETLIYATEQAAFTAFPELSQTTISTTMVFDCLSRVLFLEDEFEKELNVIAKHCPSPALFGVISLGEIANSQSGAIRLLNKSIVISSW
ncbi:FIST signal transduction protein [Colwellia sp. 75C3]|uniref:FIST signal transduction protein n=1 Tax=Colwellia sp. 75C3 TaxID=888425 RepID=UPI0018E35D62|nr:FIST C-terminal domain-containing protein [Colwellia sp. 75C3]